MKNFDIVRMRLHNQRLVESSFKKPDEVVRWLGAVQAQDFAGAKWGLGLRVPNSTDSDIEQAFTKGTILRTHMMRPTWHFVAAEDIRWMLALTSPRVHALNAYYYRKFGLDDAVLDRSNEVLAKALQGGKQLTRDELKQKLQQAGITTETVLRAAYIIMHAELDGIICSGRRKGKQFTYALLDERAPKAKILTREEALAELTRRYFTSHGPATIKDYTWWSGLTVKDARAGVEMIKSHVIYETINDKTYWFSASFSSSREKFNDPTAHFLSNYDEYTIGYTDHTPIFDPSTKTGDIRYPHAIIINGKIVGSWKRVFKKDTTIITNKLFVPLTAAENKAIISAARTYSKFLGMPVILS